MLVKICGLTRREDAEVANAAGADLLGFIFVPGSKRALDPTRSGWIKELTGAATVGVFLDAPLDLVRTVRTRLDLDWVQLHGSEPDSYLEALGSQVVRRVPVAGGVDWQRVVWLGERCLPLVDPGAGDGITCDWRSFSGRPSGVRFGLAGGLCPANLAEAISATRPRLVDVSSGVEQAPGIKDPELVRAFIAKARALSTGELQPDA
jgi:phosphoribosylanthranilate isomerase